MSDQIKGLPQSVHDRLLNIARKANRPYNELQQRFAMERFLYRLSVSPFADQFTLKGALAFLAWTKAGSFYRPTMDIDLLGRTSNSEENLIRIFQAVVQQQVPDDGLRFDPDSVSVEPIAEEAEYHGIRVRLLGRLANARISMQIDIGFSDAPVPQPEPVQLPTLLDFPAPSMLGYRPESTIAEKFQAMVDRDIRNSRMKDFADLWFLSNHFGFDGAVLANAIAETFRRRDTAMPVDPAPLSSQFAEDTTKQTQWAAFLRKGKLKGLPEQFSQVITDLQPFLQPIAQTIGTSSTFTGTWVPSMGKRNQWGS